APVGGGLAPAPVLGERGQLGGVAAGDAVHARHERQVEEAVDLSPGVRMGAAHELLADQGDVQGLFHRGGLRLRRIGAARGTPGKEGAARGKGTSAPAASSRGAAYWAASWQSLTLSEVFP